MVVGRIKKQFQRAFAPIARFFARSRISPNAVTLLGPIVATIAAWEYYQQQLLFALLLLLLSGFVDALDGAIARATGKTSPFGGVLDSICDRYSDAIVLCAIILGGWISPFWGIIALIGSLLVSYARARAEAAGVTQLGIGIAERPERLIIIMVTTFLQYLTVVGILFSPPLLFDLTNWLGYGVVLVAILAHITVVQRTVMAYRQLATLKAQQESGSEAGDTS
ncbi:MAG: archaetidylinositol phosphate synthase [Candidatus Hermodarchaeota archaeon]|nr:archaetidylinositol phosphate synthase [Candidatus Hermodarchaeota archaeon]